MNSFDIDINISDIDTEFRIDLHSYFWRLVGLGTFMGSANCSYGLLNYAGRVPFTPYLA
jgi:hypothetical protein